MKTTHEIKITFRGFHNVTIPAGAPLQAHLDGLGRPCYSVRPEHVETDSPRYPWSIWAHDTKHYYIWAPSEVIPAKA